MHFYQPIAQKSRIKKRHPENPDAVSYVNYRFVLPLLQDLIEFDLSFVLDCEE